MRLFDVIVICMSIPKTVYVNFKMLPISEAFKLPIWISYHTKIDISGGSVVLPKSAKTFGVRIGFHECLECNPAARTLLRIRGKLAFGGETHIGRGSKIIVNKGALLELGDNFAISASSTISCYKHIKFGRDIQFSWDCLVMDSDTHTILDENGLRMNEDKEIIFGNKIWIGNGCMILKGTSVPDYSVVGARSVVIGSKFESHSVIVGCPAKSVKRIGDFRI